MTPEGHDVMFINDLSRGINSNVDQKQCKFIETSISFGAKLKRELKSSEVFFDLGTRGSRPLSIKNLAATHKVNASGTTNFLEAARENHAHIIFSSLSSV